MNETDKAYAAGLFDGEGCVRIEYRKYSSNHNRRAHVLCLFVSNTKTSALDWLKQQWGGWVGKTAKPQGEGHKQGWHWRAQANKAAYFLDDISPHLKIKQLEVGLALQFQSNKTAPKPLSEDGGHFQSLTGDELRWRDMHRILISYLNSGRILPCYQSLA